MACEGLEEDEEDQKRGYGGQQQHQQSYCQQQRQQGEGQEGKEWRRKQHGQGIVQEPVRASLFHRRASTVVTRSNRQTPAGTLTPMEGCPATREGLEEDEEEDQRKEGMRRTGRRG